MMFDGCGVEMPDLGNDEMDERSRQTKSSFVEQMETSIDMDEIEVLPAEILHTFCLCTFSGRPP